MAFKFEKLEIWQESIQFVNDIYAMSKKLPKAEQFGLTSQLNRAAVSISVNIAEGAGRNSDADLSRFIQISIGSLNEVVTLLHICLNQKHIDKDTFDGFYTRCEYLSKKMYSFRNYLRS